jgi:Phosphotransferase enzyme family
MSARRTDTGWLSDARSWIEAHVGAAGPIEQPHVRPWATVVRVPAKGETFWFKASVPALAHEAAVIDVLARHRPDFVPEVVAAEPDRGWMLQRDAGARLRDMSPTEAMWERILPSYAVLQRDVAPAADELRAAGAFDRRVAGLPTQLERLLSSAEHGLSGDEAAALRSRLSEIEEACAELTALRVPETIQHDDFHDAQVFVCDGRCRILDWGDACVSHPFATLMIALASTDERGWDRGRLRDAYLEPFTSIRPLADLRSAVPAAIIVGAVTRVLKWVTISAGIEGYEDAVAVRLRALRDELDN